jgi:glycosyltransferase involved in cell wall biosynthesis
VTTRPSRRPLGGPDGHRSRRSGLRHALTSRLRGVATLIRPKRTRLGSTGQRALFDAAWYQHLVGEDAASDPWEHFVSTGSPAGLDPHPLFHVSWYARQAPEAGRTSLDAVAHYLSHGGRAGLDPHPMFDTGWYLSQHGDAAGPEAPLLHYLKVGVRRGHRVTPLFDRSWYLADNPDVAALRQDPFLHFVRYGLGELRSPHPLLALSWYAGQHPETAGSGVAALEHFLTVGRQRALDPSPIFDAQWYLERYPDVAESGLDPLTHFLTIGEAQLRDPNPLFDSSWYLAQYPQTAESGLTPLMHYFVSGAEAGLDPGPDFNTSWYLERYDDVARSGDNPLMHFLADGDYQGREPTSGQDPTPRLLGKDGAWFSRQVERAARLEPLLANVLGHDLADHQLATRAPRSAARDGLKRLFGSLRVPPDRLVLVPSLPLGGAERVAANFANAVAALFPDESVLVLATDGDTALARDWFAPEVEVRFLGLDRHLSLARRGTAVARFIDALRPRAVLNVNSAAGWDMLERHGAAVQQVTSLTAALFCRDYSVDGVLGGYADRYFRSTYSVLDALYSDHQGFLLELCDTYGVPTSQRGALQPIYQPVPFVGSRDASGRAAGRTVLWAGRITAQKRPGLLAAVARSMPDTSFLVHGTPDPLHQNWADALPSNVILRGGFTAVDQLPVDEVDLFLYTSAWDGLPNVLLELAAREVPIVATDSGGINELVTPETGWLVPVDDPVALTARLREALDDPVEAARRASEAAQVVRARHSWSHFVHAVGESPFGSAQAREVGR